MKEESFKARVVWQQKEKEALAAGLNYSRDHVVSFPGKSELEASSGTAFRGNRELVNPEEMLAGSLASCQMLTYLYLCARNEMTVLAYKDEAVAYLGRGSNERHAVERITLSPRITFKESESQQFRAMAIRLIHEAHDQCFIANSLKCEVEIQPLFIWT